MNLIGFQYILNIIKMSFQKSQIKDESTIKPEHQEITPIEILISKVGGQHRYQLWLFIIFSIMWFVTSWLLVGQAFFFDPTYKCKDPRYTNKEQCENHICGLTSRSERVNQIQSHASSIIFQFGQKYLICDLAYIATILQSMVYLGSLIGFFTIPYIADNLGRRIAVIISWLICTFGVFMVVISDSDNMVGIGYFFAGFGANPAITLGYTLINQEVLGKKRQFYGVGIQIFLAIGQATIGLIFLSVLQWYQIGYILLALCIFVNVLTLFLIESPKFLISRNAQKCLTALNQIAIRNNRETLQIEEVEKVYLAEIKEGKGENSNLIDLFKYKSMRWKSIAAGVVFMAIQIIYYSTSLNIGSVGSNMVVNQVIVGLSEGAGYLSAQFIINRIRRKITSLIGMALSGGFCLVLTVFDYIDDTSSPLFTALDIVVLLISRFILCCVWVMFYVYLTEIFPTSVRSLGLGWASAVGTVGSSASPYLIFISNSIGISTWIFPAIFGFLGAASIIFLSETFQKKTLQEIQQKILARSQNTNSEDALKQSLISTD